MYYSCAELIARQCLGFCSADSQANEDQKSAVQKPKHFRTTGFLTPLIIFQEAIAYRRRRPLCRLNKIV